MSTWSKIQQTCLPPQTIPKKARPCVGADCITQDIDQASWVMIGVPDDRGVKNNFGRIGAKKGPDAFRQTFYALPMGATAPQPNSIYDLGNLKLTTSIKSTHEKLIGIIAFIKSTDPAKKTLVIGGGHDIAFAEIAGCLGNQKKNKHHIVNLDAHSDVRPYEKNNVISSGTPFYRLIQEQGIQGSHYHPFGLQRPSNNPDLVSWMQTHKVDAHWLEDMPTEKQQLKALQTLLASLKNKKWHFNIDLDAFAVQHAPGVSAQGSFGLTPHLFLQIQKHKQIFKTLETVGIYELAPKYDIDNRTAKLAAKIAYQILSV